MAEDAGDRFDSFQCRWTLGPVSLLLFPPDRSTFLMTNPPVGMVKCLSGRPRRPVGDTGDGRSEGGRDRFFFLFSFSVRITTKTPSPINHRLQNEGTIDLGCRVGVGDS